MASTSENKEQQHPLYKGDRAIVESLLAVTTPTDYNLAELARLQIRYRGFPGARDVQADLEKVMQSWGLTETTLYEATRQLHAKGSIYQGRANKGEEEDWS
jgi:hypothetical protein